MTFAFRKTSATGRLAALSCAGFVFTETVASALTAGIALSDACYLEIDKTSTEPGMAIAVALPQRRLPLGRTPFVWVYKSRARS
jgi:hypothetical protein